MEVCSEAALVRAVDGFVSNAENTKRAASAILQDVGPQNFIKTKLGTLCGIMGLYRDLFCALGVSGRGELDDLVKKFYRKQEVVDCMESLLEFEESWDKFISHFDKVMSNEISTSKMMRVGDCFQGKHEVVNVDTGQTLSTMQALCQDSGGYTHILLHDFENLNCKVVLITFGPVIGAKRWKSDTEVGFDMFTDESRSLYSLFNLGRSFSKVWGIEPLMNYGTQMANGSQLIPVYEDIEDDPHQMGGDFVVSRHPDGEWKTTLLHRSESSSDRPTVLHLLEHLKKLS